MTTQGSFDWQGRLESDGVVVFGSRWFSWLAGSGQLTVTHVGVRLGRRPVTSFDRIAAVSTTRRRLTFFYTPRAEERMNPFERRTGQKRLLFALPRWSSVRADDLAVWVLKLKGGPMAEIDTKVAGAGMARVHRLRGDGG
jgi:hypothetical protein